MHYNKEKSKRTSRKTIKYMFKYYEIKTDFDVKKTHKQIIADTLESMFEAKINYYFGYEKVQLVNSKTQTV